MSPEVATSISASPSSPKKGKPVTITVSVPNVNTVDLTATVSGAGTSGTIRLVDGSMTGEAKTFSKSITVTPTSTGTIKVVVSSGSNAVLNGQYVNVSASKNITVTEPQTNTGGNSSSGSSSGNSSSSSGTTNKKPTTNTTKPVETPKSTDSTLSALSVKEGAISPEFKKDVKEYSLTIPYETSEVNVTATATDSKAKVAIEGNKDLKEGENTAVIKVTAEDGTVTEKTVATVVNGVVKPRFFPDLSNLNNLSFLSGIVLLFAGVEVQAVHAADMENPKKQYPLAIFISSIIVFVLFTFGSLAIAAVVPNSQLKLESGLLQALTTMLTAVKMKWALYILAFCIAFGSLGGVLSWISGPSKGLLTTAKDGLLPEKLAETTKSGAPKNMMLIQGVIVTILASLYFFMKNVSVAFFLLSALTIAVYIIMYILMYAAAIVLRKKQPNLERPYKAPALKFIAIVGILAAIFALILSFVPPAQLPIGKPASYIAIVAIGYKDIFRIREDKSAE